MDAWSEDKACWFSGAPIFRRVLWSGLQSPHSIDRVEAQRVPGYLYERRATLRIARWNQPSSIERRFAFANRRPRATRAGGQPLFGAFRASAGVDIPLFILHQPGLRGEAGQRIRGSDREKKYRGARIGLAGR